MAARGLIAVAALLIGLAPGGSVFAAAAANPGQLVKVVVVSRHGVRAPLNKPEELALWADKDWPDLVKDWQVSKPGLLTPAGKALAKLMGEYYRVLLASENLLPARACPTVDSLFVWADVAHSPALARLPEIHPPGQTCRVAYASQNSSLRLLT